MRPTMTDKVISQEMRCKSPDDCVFDRPLSGAACVFCGRVVCTSHIPGKQVGISQQFARALLKAAKLTCKDVLLFATLKNGVQSVILSDSILTRLEAAIAACEKGEGDG